MQSPLDEPRHLVCPAFAWVAIIAAPSSTQAVPTPIVALPITASPEKPGASADPVQALRAATAEQHALLDSQLPLAREGTGLDEYLQHLSVLHDWLLQIAPVLRQAPWADAYLDAVARDLAESGIDPYSPSSAATQAHAGRAPAPADAAYAMGVAYVVEGSQLGGRVLLRRLRDGGVPHSLRYLEGRGAATGSHWTAFLTALRVSLATPQALASACEGARWAFDILLTRYRRLGLLP